FSVGRARVKEALFVAIHDYGEGGFSGGRKFSHGKHQRFTVNRNQSGEGKSLLLVETRDADLPFIGAKHENLWLAVALPISHGEIADAGESWKGFGGSERAVLLLKMN